MSGVREVSALVHKDLPPCCRATVLDFAAHDRYMGGGEPGDQIGCGCGHRLVYSGNLVLGWRLLDD